MNRENEKVLMVVDEALKQYGTNVISVDINNDDMIDVDICGQHWNDSYMKDIADVKKCNIDNLKEELNKRNISYCF